MAKQFSLKIVLGAVDKATGTIRKVSSEIDKKFAPLAKLKKNINMAAKDLGLPQVSKGFSNTLGAAKDVTSELAKLGAMGGVVAVGIGALAVKTAAYGANLDDLSKKVGINSKSLQEYQYAAEQSGTTADQFNSGILTFSKNLGMARAGTGKLTKFLDRVSPSLKRSLLGAKSNEEAFNLMMGAISNVKNPQKRLALASAAFGDVGESIQLMAENGTEGLNKLRKDAQDLGFAMPDGDVAKAAEFDDQIQKMGFVLTGVRNIFGSAFMPVLSEGLTDLLKYFRDNRAGIAEFAGQFAAAIRAIIPILVSGMQAVKNFFMPLNSETGKSEISLFRVKLALAAVALVIIGPLLASTVTLIGSLASLTGSLVMLGIKLVATASTMGVFSFAAKALSIAGTFLTGSIGGIIAGLKALFVVMMANPIFAVIAAVAALGLAAYYLVDDWSFLKEWLSDFFGWVSEKFAALSEWVGSIFGGDKSMNVKVNQTAQPFDLAASKAAVAQNSSVKQEAAVKVSFDNLPAGAKVETKASSGMDFGMNLKTGPMVTY